MGDGRRGRPSGARPHLEYRDHWVGVRGHLLRHPSRVESLQSVAEELPGLYREVLDAIAEFERDGSRAQAGRFRAQASAAYGRAWDESARRNLEGLLRTIRTDADAGERRRAAGHRSGIRFLRR